MKEKIKRALNLNERYNVRWALVFYDIIVFLVVDISLLVVYVGFVPYNNYEVIANSVFALVSILSCRFLFKIYTQIWRFGSIECYIKFLIADSFAFLLFLAMEFGLCPLLEIKRLSYVRILALISLNLIISLAMRMAYRYCFKCGNENSLRGKVSRALIKLFAGGIDVSKHENTQKIRVAIVGAGTAGVSLAERFIRSADSTYMPVCFFDSDKKKAGREVQGVPVFHEEDETFEMIKEYNVQEIVFALPPNCENRRELYDYYKKSGCKIKVYDHPSVHDPNERIRLREFDIDDLLFRRLITMSDEKIKLYYSDKVILITGGGGSIGSELCRQLAKMNPKQIIILDIYENGVYDIQQELRFKHKDVDLRVEIASITNKVAMARVFELYHPQVVINAAAHKHVPLMEHNCIEAVENNVFGTKVVLELCEEYGAERFMMVSTDKAVNPTNVMGATKRMCEMIVQAYSTRGKVKCSSTRFGNVLGSAGSVIPLFKKQIAAGGPVTLTDKRIIRYFMTIPEASQLVLQSGAMAKSGELFVLDMGQPVKIYDLAKNMINLSGAEDIEIVETGLRPGEKLYEELLVKSETLETTDNELIFIEKEEPVSYEQLEQKLDLLKKACDSGDDDSAREALRKAVPTFKKPEVVNNQAENTMEMNLVKKI